MQERLSPTKSVSELCRYMRISRQRVWQLIREGRIPMPARISPSRSEFAPGDFEVAIAVMRKIREKIWNKRKTIKNRKKRIAARKEQKARVAEIIKKFKSKET
jgi:predicted DNA-binding transcriptional regulator AlpA